jgi:hypothetical protein
MKAILLNPILSCFLVMTSSCLSTKVQLSPKMGALAYEKSTDFYWWGLSPEKVSLASHDICLTDEATAIETKKTFWNAFLTTFSLGIYSPKTVYIWCSRE